MPMLQILVYFFPACEYYGSLVQLFYEMGTLWPDVKVLLIFGISWGLASREEPSQTANVVGARSNNSVGGSQRSVEAARGVNVRVSAVTWLLSRVLRSSETNSHEGFIRLSHDCKACRHLVNRRRSSNNLTICFIRIFHRWGYTDIRRCRGEMKKLHGSWSRPLMSIEEAKLKSSIHAEEKKYTPRKNCLERTVGPFMYLSP